MSAWEWKRCRLPRNKAFSVPVPGSEMPVRAYPLVFSSAVVRVCRVYFDDQKLSTTSRWKAKALELAAPLLIAISILTVHSAEHRGCLDAAMISVAR